MTLPLHDRIKTRADRLEQLQYAWSLATIRIEDMANKTISEKDLMAFAQGFFEHGQYMPLDVLDRVEKHLVVPMMEKILHVSMQRMGLSRLNAPFARLNMLFSDKATPAKTLENQEYNFDMITERNYANCVLMVNELEVVTGQPSPAFHARLDRIDTANVARNIDKLHNRDAIDAACTRLYMRLSDTYYTEAQTTLRMNDIMTAASYLRTLKEKDPQEQMTYAAMAAQVTLEQVEIMMGTAQNLLARAALANPFADTVVMNMPPAITPSRLSLN